MFSFFLKKMPLPTRAERKELAQRYKDEFTNGKSFRRGDLIQGLYEKFSDKLSEPIKLCYKTLTGILVQQGYAAKTINQRIKSPQALFFLIELKKHYIDYLEKRENGEKVSEEE